MEIVKITYRRHSSGKHRIYLYRPTTSVRFISEPRPL